MVEGRRKNAAERIVLNAEKIIEADGSARHDLDGDGILILEIGNGSKICKDNHQTP